jgi:hypothetical protein
VLAGTKEKRDAGKGESLEDGELMAETREERWCLESPDAMHTALFS